MKKFYIISLLLFSSLIAFSCASKIEDDSPDHMIIGDWSVADSGYAWNGEIVYAPAEGFDCDEYIVSFLKSGKTKETINGVKKEGSYELIDDVELLWNGNYYKVITLTEQALYIEAKNISIRVLGVRANMVIYFSRVK